MTTKRGIVFAAMAAAGVLVSACGASPGELSADNRTCKAADCSQGVVIDFSFRDAGAYVFEVTFDGLKTTCKATLPLPRQPGAACDPPDVLLGLAGPPLPENQQSIEGLRLLTTTAQSISVRATRDGTPIGEKTFVPPYVTTPGPNGPECAPKQCTLANVTFP